MATGENLKSILNLHVNALQVVENELQRLHSRLSAGDGDEDTLHEQIGELHGELMRLSEKLNEIEEQLVLTGE